MFIFFIVWTFVKHFQTKGLKFFQEESDFWMGEIFQRINIFSVEGGLNFLMGGGLKFFQRGLGFSPVWGGSIFQKG